MDNNTGEDITDPVKHFSPFCLCWYIQEWTPLAWLPRVIEVSMETLYIKYDIDVEVFCKMFQIDDRNGDPDFEYTEGINVYET